MGYGYGQWVMGNGETSGFLPFAGVSARRDKLYQPARGAELPRAPTLMATPHRESRFNEQRTEDENEETWVTVECFSSFYIER